MFTIQTNALMAQVTKFHVVHSAASWTLAQTDRAVAALYCETSCINWRYSPEAVPTSGSGTAWRITPFDGISTAKSTDCYDGIEQVKALISCKDGMVHSFVKCRHIILLLLKSWVVVRGGNRSCQIVPIGIGEP